MTDSEPTTNAPSTPAPAPRRARVERKTRETDIALSLVLDGVGHFAHIEDPRRVADRMIEFLGASA